MLGGWGLGGKEGGKVTEFVWLGDRKESSGINGPWKRKKEEQTAGVPVGVGLILIKGVLKAGKCQWNAFRRG